MRDSRAHEVENPAIISQYGYCPTDEYRGTDSSTASCGSYELEVVGFQRFVLKICEDAVRIAVDFLAFGFERIIRSTPMPRKYRTKCMVCRLPSGPELR